MKPIFIIILFLGVPFFAIGQFNLRAYHGRKITEEFYFFNTDKTFGHNSTESVGTYELIDNSFVMTYFSDNRKDSLIMTKKGIYKTKKNGNPKIRVKDGFSWNPFQLIFGKRYHFQVESRCFG